MVELSVACRKNPVTYALLVPSNPHPCLTPVMMAPTHQQSPRRLLIQSGNIVSVPTLTVTSNTNETYGNAKGLSISPVLGHDLSAKYSDAPLDLSCPKILEPEQEASEVKDSLTDLPPMVIPRSGSCSSTSSYSSLSSLSSTASFVSSCSSLTDVEKKQKRKDQNKAAAQNYRQRKKSFSELIDSEHDSLARRNGQLKNQKTKLDEQIRKMRALLNDVIEASKREEMVDNADTASEPPNSSLSARTAQFEVGGGSQGQCCWISQKDGAKKMMNTNTTCVPTVANDDDQSFSIRPRKYSWPMTLSSRERKKEQNKLASRRFRQRRKREQSYCEKEVVDLEYNNKKLRDRCEELESKIKLLKEIMNKNKKSNESN